MTSNRALDAMLVWRIKQMLNGSWSPRADSRSAGKDGIKVSVQSVYNIITSGTRAAGGTAAINFSAGHRQAGNRSGHQRSRPYKHGTTALPGGRRKRFGDFEMDLIVDGHGHAILVLVERLTNFVMMEKLPHGKKAGPVAKAVVENSSHT